MRKVKKEYFQKLITDNNNITTVWNAINTFIRPNKTLGHSSWPSLDVNEFNNYFLSVADELTPTGDNIPQLDNRYLEEFCRKRLGSCEFKIPLLGVHEVGRCIESLNKKSVGPDGINSSILKLSLPYILDSLTHIYNLCISKGTFPTEWKKAKIIPLPKVKSPSGIDDFRPISVLSILSKPIEKHIHKHLLSYLNEHNLIHPLQSGFRPNHSCHTSLTNLVDNWLPAINNSDVVGSVFLDFEKAFDMVHHGKLFDKLTHYLRDTTALNLFQSFLENRQQRVHVNGKVSDFGTLKAGVPQGSVLGPVLFCLFINDLPIHFSDRKVVCAMFADDTTLYASSNSIDTVTNTLQTSLDELSCWCSANHMVLNPCKTKCMSISTRQKHQIRPLSLSLFLGTKPLQRVNNHKLLGVIIDDHLDWNSHINKLCHKISSNLFLLSKLRHFVDIQACMIFFNAHILSHINYASTLWDCCSEVNFKRVNSLYRRASKLIISNKHLTTDEKMQSLNLVPLRKHLQLNKCVFMKKILDGHAPIYLSNFFEHSPIRGRKHLVLPQPRIDLFKSSLSYSGVVLWNNIPENIKQIKTITTFKVKMRSFLTYHVTWYIP